MKARPKRFDRRLKALEAKVAKIGLNKSRMPLAIAKEIRDADADLWDWERRKPKDGDEDYQFLMDAYEWRCQELRKIIADGVDAIVRIEGRYYTLHEVMREKAVYIHLWRSVGEFDLKAANHFPEKKNSNMPC